MAYYKKFSCVFVSLIFLSIIQGSIATGVFEINKKKSDKKIYHSSI